MNVTIRELPADLQPTNRIQYAGAGALSSAEILAIILGSGTRDENAIRLGETLLSTFDGLPGLLTANMDELCQVPGIGPAKAAKVTAALELGKRGLTQSPADRLQIRTPSDVAHLLMLEMGILEQEHLRTVLLDTKNYVTRVAEIYAGSLNAAVVRIGEVFRDAIRSNSAAIILAHNHPSGDPTPSPEDVRVTEMIVEAGQLLDIKVLDHIIVGRNRFVSLKERGLGFK